MMRSLVLCAVLAAVGGCGTAPLEDPPPEVSEGYGPLTGNWTGWCCSHLVDAHWGWYVQLIEGGDGELTGTFTLVEVLSILPVPPRVSTGSVVGTRRGADVSLVFAYADGEPAGRPVRFKGRQISPDRFGISEVDLRGGRRDAQFSRTEMDVSPGFFSLPLTGEWWGSCCVEAGGFAGPEYRVWHVHIVEDDVGDLTGTVELELRNLATGETLRSAGTVAGRRIGTEVVLDFAYTEGDHVGLRTRFVGHRNYPGGFEGSESSNPDMVTWFGRQEELSNSPPPPMELGGQPRRWDRD